MNRIYTGMNDDDEEELQPTSSNQFLIHGAGGQATTPTKKAASQKKATKLVPSVFGVEEGDDDDDNVVDGGAASSSSSAAAARNNGGKGCASIIPAFAVATPDELKELTPEQMSNYTEGPILGRGTYGTVYMAMLTIGKLVAVKVVPILKKQKAESLTSIKREVDVLRNMSHPNVIRCYGCSYPPRKDSICIFMELATSGSLTQIVRRFGGLNENVVQVYSKQILRGLQYLHGRGVIHRDIKGENILIDGNGVAKLGDFGCSKFLADVANKSQAGCASLVGSPFWMAPEVIRNEAYGTKADVWSLGCTVVEMLNGGHPPWSETFDNVYSAMYYIGNTPSLPSNIPAGVSDLCRDFLARCFERDVSKRASVSEMLAHPWLSEENMGSPLTPDQLHTAIQHGGNISASNNPSHPSSLDASQRQANDDEDDADRDGDNDVNDGEGKDGEDGDEREHQSASTPSTTTKKQHGMDSRNHSNAGSDEGVEASGNGNNGSNGGARVHNPMMPRRGWSGLFDGLASGNASTHMTGDSTFNPSTLSGGSHQTARSTF